MRQDLVDWLNGTIASSGRSEPEAGLLVAPLGTRPEPVPEEPKAPEEPELPDMSEPPEETDVPKEPDTPDMSDIPEEPEGPEVLNMPTPPELPIEAPDPPEEPEAPEEPDTPEVDDPEPPEEPDVPEEPIAPVEEPDAPEAPDPLPRPPALWTHVVSMPDRWGPQSPEEIPEEWRDTFFAQKLHSDLRARRVLAAERREQDIRREAKRTKSRVWAFFLCLIPLLALAASYVALRYLQGNSPDYLNLRATELCRQERYDEAMELYQEAYRRYPDVLSFLTGLALSSERAGQLQTAIAAWTDYLDALPEGAPHRAQALQELNRLREAMNPAEDSEPPLPIDSVPVSPDEPPAPPSPLSWDQRVRLGTEALNQRRYDDAIRHFFYALELRKEDLKPWLGLSEAYWGRGMRFEARRVLDEARRRFRDPTLEVRRREMNAR